MEAYDKFAAMYDLFMDNVPYEKWADLIRGILHNNGIKDGLLLDLGCGSGTMTEYMAEMGYDMIGVDSSEQMLEMALRKRDISGHDILYLNQDMRTFELYGTVAGIICTCDCINYLIEDEYVMETFKNVYNYLDDEGIFIFDINTRYKYESVLGDNTFAEVRDSSGFIWNNYFDTGACINQYDLTFFMEDEDGRYSRFEETHIQRAYTRQEIEDMLVLSGMKILKCFDEATGKDVTSVSEKIFYVCQRPGRT